MPYMDIYEDMVKVVDETKKEASERGYREYEFYVKKAISPCRESLANYLPLFKMADTKEIMRKVLEELIFGTTQKSMLATAAKIMESTTETEAISFVLSKVALRYGKILIAFENGEYEIS